MEIKTSNTRVRLPGIGEKDQRGDSPLRNAWRQGTGDAAQMMYELTPPIADYADFPALLYYINVFGVFPSAATGAYFFLDEEFQKNIRPHEDAFYTEISYEKKEVAKKNFVFYHHKDHSIVLYVRITEGYGYIDPDSGMSRYSVTALYNPAEYGAEVLEKVISEIIQATKHEPTISTIGNINILVSDRSSFSLDPRPIARPDIDFSCNYNEGFEKVHDHIQESLSKNQSKGLVLLHGHPGSGKTSYIRYLIHELKKRVIYIPPNLAESISSPDIIKFFMGYPNSVIVIEDAENVLAKRAGGSSQSVANILNFTDGILSDCMNIQIVATFNCNHSSIDDALMRKGRLISRYEFGELSPDRSDKLCEKLGVKLADGAPRYLSEIYNASSESFKMEKPEMGFLAQSRLGSNLGGI